VTKPRLLEQSCPSSLRRKSRNNRAAFGRGAPLKSAPSKRTYGEPSGGRMAFTGRPFSSRMSSNVNGE
jgi:hypothetical protein